MLSGIELHLMRCCPGWCRAKAEGHERIAPQRARMLSNRPYVANQSLANFPNSVCHTGKL